MNFYHTGAFGASFGNIWSSTLGMPPKEKPPWRRAWLMWLPGLGGRGFLRFPTHPRAPGWVEKVEGSETRESPKDGNHFHLSKWSFFFPKMSKFFTFLLGFMVEMEKKIHDSLLWIVGDQPPFQEQADRTTQRAGGWDLHGWCRCQLSQQLKLPCCDFSREGASAKVCYDLGGGYYFSNIFR